MALGNMRELGVHRRVASCLADGFGGEETSYAAGSPAFARFFASPRILASKRVWKNSSPTPKPAWNC